MWYLIHLLSIVHVHTIYSYADTGGRGGTVIYHTNGFSIDYLHK